MAIGSVGHWRDSAGGQIPTASWSGVNFASQIRLDGSQYTKPNNSTVQIKQAGNYLVIATLEYTGGTGPMSPQGKTALLSGAGTLWTSYNSGFMADSTDDTAWVRVFGIYHDASVDDTLQIQHRRSVDVSGTGTKANACDLQVIRIDYTAISMYRDGQGNQAMAGEGTWELNLNTTDLQTASSVISKEGSRIRLAANNKFLIFHTMAGYSGNSVLTQRQSILTIDDVHDNDSASDLHHLNSDNNTTGTVNVTMKQTADAVANLKIRGHRGSSEAEYQGGCAQDGAWKTEPGLSGICVLAMNSALDYISINQEYIQKIDGTSPVEPWYNQAIHAGTKLTLNSKGFKFTDSGDLLILANLFSGRKQVTSTARFTGYASIKIGSTTHTTGQHGAYTRGVAGSASTLGASYNMGGVYNLPSANTNVLVTARENSSTAGGGEPYAIRGILLGIDISTMATTLEPVTCAINTVSSSANASFEIVGGPAGGGLQAEKLQKVTLSFGSSDTTKDGTLTGFSNLAQIVPFGLSSRLSSNSSMLADSKFDCEIVDASTVRVSRGGSGSAATVIVYVVEFSSGTTVEKLDFSTSAVSTDKNITSVTMASAFVIGWWKSTNTTSGISPNQASLAFELQATNTVRLHLGSAGVTHTGHIYVISNPDLVVQRGARTAGGAIDVSISTAALEESFLIWSDTTSESAYEDEGNSHGYMTDANTVQFTPGYSSGDHIYYWQVITDSDLENVQRFKVSKSSTSSGNFTLTAVDLDLTVANAGHPIASTAGTSYNQAYDFSCRSTTYDITSATNLAWQKTSQNGSAVVEVITFSEPSSANPIITDIEDEKFNIAEIGVVITGTGFGALQGTGKVELCSSDDYNAADKVTQIITSWSATSITFNVTRGALTESPLWVTVRNDGFLRSDSYEVEVATISCSSLIETISSTADARYNILGFRAEINTVSSNVDSLCYHVFVANSTTINAMSTAVDSAFRVTNKWPSTDINTVSSTVDSHTERFKIQPVITLAVVSTDFDVLFKPVHSLPTEETLFHSDIDYLRDDLTDVSYTLSTTMRSFKLYGTTDLSIYKLDLVIQAKASSAGNLGYTIKHADGTVAETGNIALTTTAQIFTVPINNKNKVAGSTLVTVELTGAGSGSLYSLHLACKKTRDNLVDQYRLTPIVLLDSDTPEGVHHEVNEEFGIWRQYTRWLRDRIDQVWDVSGTFNMDYRFISDNWKRKVYSKLENSSTERRIVSWSHSPSSVQMCWPEYSYYGQVKAAFTRYSFSITGYLWHRTPEDVKAHLLYHFTKAMDTQPMWLSGQGSDLTWGYGNTVFVPLGLPTHRQGYVRCDHLSEARELEKGFLRYVEQVGYADWVNSELPMYVGSSDIFYVDRFIQGKEVDTYIDSGQGTKRDTRQGAHLFTGRDGFTWLDRFTSNELASVPDNPFSTYVCYLLGKL